MSLIPSESLSFPDSFRSTVGWKLSERRKAEPSHPELEAITVTTQTESPKIKVTEMASATLSEARPSEVLADEPESSPDRVTPEQPELFATSPGEEAARQTMTIAPAKIPIVPRKSVQRAPQIPAKIPVVPRARFRSLPNAPPIKAPDDVSEKTEPVSVEAARSLPEMEISTETPSGERSVEAPSRPKVTSPRPGPYRAEIQFFTEAERRGRWIRFIVSETVAVICLVGLVWFGLSRHFADLAMVALLGILVVAAIAAVVALPVAFIRNNPARWYRQR